MANIFFERMEFPEDISPVCGIYGEHDYCTDVDIHPVSGHKKYFPTIFEAVYCHCECHDFNGIYIPPVDDETNTIVEAR